MLRKLQYVCLVGSIGLVGADRVDVFAGQGPFTLTPFLVLAPLVVLLHLSRKGLSGRFQFAVTPSIRRQFPFIAAASLFLLLCLASIPLGLDPERGLVAFCDLLLVAVLGYCISLEILSEPMKEKLILRSVAFGLSVYLIFMIGECVALLNGVVLAPGEKPSSWLAAAFAPSLLGNWIPTLSGTTSDANRSGFVLTMYWALLDRFVTKSRYTRVLCYAIVLFILLTLSRSGALCLLAYWVFSKSFWKRLVSRPVLIRLAVLAVIVSTVCVIYQEQLGALAEAWEISDALSVKLSMGEGSSGESHLLLIQRGVDTWLKSTKTIIAGIGFAGAPKVLEDFFGNDKHGNFHDLYVTTLAEMGLPTFTVLIFLLVYPIIARKGTLPSMIAIIVFNVSYQSLMEPLFWLILALLWSFDQKRWLMPKFVLLQDRLAATAARLP
jgi:hypothetical protein